MGLATLREDGYASISGTGTVTTKPLVVQGTTLTATVDVSGGSVSFAVVSGVEKRFLGRWSEPLVETATNEPIKLDPETFANAKLSEVVIAIRIENASVYTVGFAT